MRHFIDENGIPCTGQRPVDETIEVTRDWRLVDCPVCPVAAAARPEPTTSGPDPGIHPPEAHGDPA